MSHPSNKERVSAARDDLSIARDGNTSWAVISRGDANRCHGGGLMVVYSGLSTPEAAEAALYVVVHQMADNGQCYGPSEIPLEHFEAEGNKAIVYKAARKEELIAHYRTREPKRFIQFDGFIDADECCGRDDTGQGVTNTETFELMDGTDVRVLIPTDGEATIGEIVQLLRKITEWIEHGGLEHLDGLAPARSGDTTDPDNWEMPF